MLQDQQHETAVASSATQCHIIMIIINGVLAI